MTNLILIAIGSALVNNVVLSQFLGICPFLGVSKKVDTAAGMGAAVIFVTTLAAFVTSIIYAFLLDPLEIVEMFLKKFMHALYESLGVYLPLITTNCAVLGVALNSVTYGYNILESTVYGFATAFGFFIAIVIMAGLREKIEYNDVPETFQGSAIVLVTAGLMSIAFFGFSGVI